MILWTLAWRNVLRNRRRSLITVASIAIGLAALTFLWAFIDGMNRQMVENTTRYFAGDVQVHVKGYHEDPNLDRAIADAAPLIDAVRADPAVAAASLRLEGKALASRGDKSRGVMVVGIDPASEVQVTDLFKAVVEGATLDGRAGVLIGEKLAESLGVKAGQEIVLVGQAYDGSVASSRLPVRGVFRTQIDELDGYLAVAPMATVRDFFAAPGGATAIALRLRDRGALSAAQASLAQRLGARYEVVGWPTLLPMVSVSVRYHEVMGFVVLTIFFVMVGAGVANPVLMAVLERTREFGIMLAVGTSESRLLRLVIYEAMLLGALGLLLGNVIGLAATATFGKLGINLSAFGAAQRTMPGLADIVYPVLRLERSLMVSVLLFGIAALVALYPAVKAARLDPVAAIRGIGGMLGAHSAVAGATRGRWPVFMLIAARNLLRNRRRSAITIGGTAFAIAAYVFLFGYFDGFSEQIIDNTTRYVTGHVQIERPGFRRDLAPELAIDNPRALLDTLRRTPNVEAAAPRVQVQVLASSATKSEGVMLYGIDPVAERRLTFIHRTIVAGSALEPGHDRDIVLGRKLAEKLGLRLGEKVIVMAPAANGELGTAAYRIRGLFATESSAFDGAMAFVTLPAAQTLLALGDRVSSINLRLIERERLRGTMTQLRTTLGSSDLALAPWQELMPQVDEMVGLIHTIRAIVVGIFLVVVALAVMNTVFMAVAERTREFGVMMALGTAPAAIVRMVLYETVALMAIASVLGYGLGMALVAYLGRQGLDLSAFFQDYSSIPGLTGIAYPRLVIASIVGPGVVLFVGSVAVSLVPALRASRLDPSKAIHHA